MLHHSQTIEYIKLHCFLAEERRIVYVGRIEPEKTKEDLRKIFTIFGHVVNVSIHYKE